MTIRMIIMAICLIWVTDALGQKIGKKQQPILQATELQIYNGSSEELKFKLCAKRDGDCKEFSLKSGKDGTYNDAKFISIGTAGRHTLKYQLENKERYKLAWNGQKRQWDVFHIVSK